MHGCGCWDIRHSDFLWNGVGDGRKRHQSALHGGGVFPRLPVAELLFVREGLECLISHTMHPVHSRTEHDGAKTIMEHDGVVLKNIPTGIYVQTSGYLDILFYTQQFPDTMSGKGTAEPWMANQYRLRTSPTTLTKYLDTRMSDTSSL